MKEFKFILLSLLAIAVSCTTNRIALPESDLSEVVLKLENSLAVKPGDVVSLEITSTTKPESSDLVVLRSLVKGVPDMVLPILSIEGNKLSFAIPAVFDYDVYNVCLRRAKALRGYGTVRFALVKDEDLNVEENSNVYGVISCQGNPVPGVVVSDGYKVVTTDENGLYQMQSEKANAYVYISIPSGYEVEARGIRPMFYKYLTLAKEQVERKDFSLYDAGDQTNHTMLYFGDLHMANRTKDRLQLIKFVNEINDYIQTRPAEKIYAMTLGDMTWDAYWYSDNYCFAEYLSDMNQIRNLQIFHTIGNHDHELKEEGDWKTALRYKAEMTPNYYSFNIGQVHYLVLDDIKSKNTVESTSSTYDMTLVEDVLKWMAEDLMHVEKTTPLVVTMHAPLFKYTGADNLTNAAAFKTAVNGFEKVTVFSGHTHDVYNNSKDGITEMNSGAVCGAWWWAGSYNPSFNICQDGAPDGYRVVENAGKEFTTYFKATGRDKNYQFRTYDRNCIEVTAEKFGITDPTKEVAFGKEVARDAEKGNYAQPSDENIVLINVWDWNEGWSIEVSENGTSLEAVQCDVMDPAFYLAYTVPRCIQNNDGTVTWHLNSTKHMFKVTASAPDTTLEIKVTDNCGRVYTETMTRPKPFTIENYK